LSALSALYGASLSDVRLELPEGISRVAPTRLDPIVAGSEVIVTGRLNGLALEGDAVLRGTVNGHPFEQRYPLNVTASDSSGNAFVPRLFAAERITDLERDGSDSAKHEAVALSTEHGVASRYTSLLVLESEAMYKAFGLDSAHQAPEYTADLEAEGSSASGELALSDDEAKAKAKDEAPLARADKARAAPGDLAPNAAPAEAPRAALGAGRGGDLDQLRGTSPSSPSAGLGSTGAPARRRAGRSRRPATARTRSAARSRPAASRRRLRATSRSTSRRPRPPPEHPLPRSRRPSRRSLSRSRPTR
jgi:hypothetical protein